jgi:hypothetical protein
MPPSLAQIGVFTTSYMNLESAAALGTPPSSQRPSGWECSSGLTHKPGRALLFGTRRHPRRRRMARDVDLVIRARSPSGVHEELRRLVASGVLNAASGPRGTIMALVACAN